MRPYSESGSLLLPFEIESETESNKYEYQPMKGYMFMTMCSMMISTNSILIRYNFKAKTGLNHYDVILARGVIQMIVITAFLLKIKLNPFNLEKRTIFNVVNC